MKDALLLDIMPPSNPDMIRSASMRSVTDAYKWSVEQAAHLRAGQLDQLDLSNLAEEIEDVGLRQYDNLVSNLEIVLLHMLKWDRQPKKRSRSWQASISEHHDRVMFRLEDSPSLKTKQAEALARAYRLARNRASGETKLTLASFPLQCPYSWSDIMDTPYQLDDERS